MSGVTVRLATREDAPAMARVHVRAWQVGYAHIAPQEALDALGVERREAMWRDRLALAPVDSRTWVGERAGSVLGFGGAGPARDHDLDTVGELQVLNVEPSAWRTGVGTAILEEATSFLRAAYEHAILWVAEANDRGRAFYERFGWEPDGARKSEALFGITFDEVRYRTVL